MVRVRTIGLVSRFIDASQQCLLLPLQMHPDAAHRIFVGGLPYYLEEPQIRELLGAFGAIKSFDMIRDKETRQFKGYGFVVFEDPSVTEMAIAGLHGMRMGDRQLTVRRANEGQRLIDMQTQGVQPQAVAPRVVKLIEAGMSIVGGCVAVRCDVMLCFCYKLACVNSFSAVTMEELSNDDDYSDILEDMREECGKYGSVVEVRDIPHVFLLLARPGSLRSYHSLICRRSTFHVPVRPGSLPFQAWARCSLSLPTLLQPWRHVMPCMAEPFQGAPSSPRSLLKRTTGAIGGIESARRANAAACQCELPVLVLLVKQIMPRV